MTDIAAIARMSAAAIGRALAAGEADPVELAEHLLDRIDKADDQSIFIAVTRSRALEEAQAARTRLAEGRPLSPLDGVPIAWKDLFDMKGEVTTCASDLRRNARPAAADATIVANAAAAGMVSLGKTNLTEFAYSGIGLNPHFGTPHNPFDPDTPRAPGGSSAGSAVAVASGLAPCAIGTDTGGSVRIPSAFNGLTGHKSSEGRIPKGGVFPLSETLDTVGPLARSVEDCILLDMVMRGAATTTVRRLPLSGLSLFVPETVVLTDLDSAVAANFEATLSRLEQAGVKIARGPLDIFAEIVRITAEHGSLGAAEAYHVHRSLVEGPDVGRIDRRVVARIMGGKPMSALDLVIIEHARREFAARLAEKIGDALIAMPTVPMTAPKIAPLEADDAVFGMNNLKALRNTMLGNFLNLPGLALPNGTDEHGLPTSFLLCALGGDDDRLLSYGLSVEKVVRG